MIWEQSSGVVVMLSSLSENGVVKCDCYWPEEGQTKKYGGLLVHNRKTFSSSGTTIIRSLFIKPEDGSQPHREIMHIEFGGWPDYGAVQDSKAIASLIGLARRLKDRSSINNLTGPMVVHCSAGVGRTGTFIAIDIVTQRLQHRMSTDIPKIVKNLRWQRPMSVMTISQYNMIYNVSKEGVTTPGGSCNNNSISINNKNAAAAMTA